MSWNYFKNFKVILKNIYKFKPSKDPLIFTYSENNYTHYIIYNVSKETLKISYKHFSEDSYSYYNTTTKFSTSFESIVFCPSYVFYYIYIKNKLSLN